MVPVMGFLIFFPLLIALLLLFIKGDTQRAAIVYAGAAGIAIASLTLIALGINQSEFFEMSSEFIDLVCTLVGVIIAAIILKFAFQYKNILAGVLACVQLILSLVFDIFFAKSAPVAQGLYIDSLGLIMTFIIGIIGSAICVYALGYMQDFQKHEPDGSKDRRPIFFALMFIFLSAMFVIVYSNNMLWLFTGWEITTVCSFLLIGYTKTAEAIRNAFRQIILNLLGGIAFVLAMFISVAELGTLDFDKFINYAVAYPELCALAVGLLAFAGLTKAAQMPFHSWLLGAMVAPTPTSALLHSSTMVKAGVFLLVKLAPVFLVCTVPAVMVMIVGMFTFLMCSLMAISQSNGKRVLAYSTIANLGLIAACAGVGTPEAVWAACFLILFHAVAKSLLFLCVGTAEHHIGSRDIEDMDLLFEKMPRLARFMMLGIMCMFIAPFGMLVAKWATLVSLVDTGHIILILILGFGSAATFMFWAKWLGKLSGIAACKENIETTVHKSEWIPLVLMALLIVVFCVTIPLLSQNFVVPYLSQAYDVYGIFSTLLISTYGQFVPNDDLAITAICVAAIVVVLFLTLDSPSKKYKKVNVYLAGVTQDSSTRTFKGSLSKPVESTSRNWYMTELFGEVKLTPFSTIFAITILALCLVISAFIMLGVL